MTPVDRIRHLLDRRLPPASPPRVHEPTARLVYTDLGLPPLFAHAAAGLSARLVHVEDLAAAVAASLADAGLAAAAVTPGPLVRKVRLAEGLADLGLSVADPAPAAPWSAAATRPSPRRAASCTAPACRPAGRPPPPASS